MTTYAMWQLRCDGPDGCPASLDDATAGSASEAIKVGQTEKWERRRIMKHWLDLCPEHSSMSQSELVSMLLRRDPPRE